MIQAYIIIGFVEGVVAILLFIRWQRREDRWTPYIARDSDNQLAVGVQKWTGKVIVTCVRTNAPNFADELAKAEADAREKALLLNSTERSLERASR